MGIPTNIINKLLNVSNDNRLYNINDVVFNEGSNFKGLYYMQEGEVKIVKKGVEKNVLIWMAEPGLLIGLQSFFQNKNNKYSYSAITTSAKSKLLFIPEKKFDDLLQTNPEFKLELGKELCKRIDYAEDRLKSFFKKSTKERFAESLIKFANKTVSKDNVPQYKIARSQLNNLADYVGTSLEYILKLIREFKRKRLISDDEKDYIIISDLDRILQISGSNVPV